MLGTVFVLLSLGLNYYINAQGFSATGMITVAIGAVINMLLDPLFIYVFKMGVSGAALATIISQTISCLWVLYFLIGKKAIIRLQRKNMKLQKIIVKKILALGTSGFVQQVTNSTVQVVCNITLALWGGDLYIGVMTVINSVREIIHLPVTGFSNGGQPVLSYNYGAKEYKRCIQTIKLMTLITFIYTTVSWLIIGLYPSFFIHIFNTQKQLVQAVIPALGAYFFGFCFMSFQFAGQSVFVGLGKSKQAIFFSIFRKVIIVVPLTILLPRIFGVMGVFYAEPISNLIGGAACYITMLMTVGKELRQEKS
ncbi:MATE family efflux transporter [Eggerthia catenaformis]|uniref:MATE family efflux transporter n=2 Tax=Eggerthia catenaformis TaxID=31973 RepID=UPI00248E6B8A|nr:MATE family efflux transporter [Eggerthia catenaformis]